MKVCSQNFPKQKKEVNLFYSRKAHGGDRKNKGKEEGRNEEKSSRNSSVDYFHD